MDTDEHGLGKAIFHFIGCEETVFPNFCGNKISFLYPCPSVSIRGLNFAYYKL